MTNDNKTLADVQPGGRVRLGDGDEKPPQELPKLIVTRGDGIPLPDQAAGIEEFKRQCLRRIGAEFPHLSAQPSPGRGSNRVGRAPRSHAALPLCRPAGEGRGTALLARCRPGRHPRPRVRRDHRHVDGWRAGPHAAAGRSLG